MAGLAMLLTAAVHARMDTSAKTGQGRLRAPSPDRVRLTSLGFDAVVADYYWLQTLQLIGGDKGDSRRHASLIGELIDVVTTLDPWAGPAYRLAAVWLTDSPESVRTANRLLRRGIAYEPLDWRNRYHLGFNYFFYLEENVRAAEIFEEALPLEGVPNYLGALIARLRMNYGGLEMAAGFLSELARNAPDEYARAEYLKSLDEVETERRARYLDAAREEYWRRNGRDITRVEDLTRGDPPVVPELPEAHPHFDIYHWVLDPKSGQIVSTFYGSRYELHLTQRERERRRRWHEIRETEEPAREKS